MTLLQILPPKIVLFVSFCLVIIAQIINNTRYLSCKTLSASFWWWQVILAHIRHLGVIDRPMPKRNGRQILTGTSTNDRRPWRQGGSSDYMDNMLNNISWAGCKDHINLGRGLNNLDRIGSDSKGCEMIKFVSVDILQPKTKMCLTVNWPWVKNERGRRHHHPPRNVICCLHRERNGQLTLR
jgi:hypothetical protein